MVCFFLVIMTNGFFFIDFCLVTLLTNSKKKKMNKNLFHWHSWVLTRKKALVTPNPTLAFLVSLLLSSTFLSNQSIRVKLA